MMINRSSLLVFLLPLWMASTSLAFVIPSPTAGLSSSSSSSATTTTTELSVGWTLGGGGGGYYGETEDDARFVLSRAKQCAYGDETECSVDDAQELLNEMLHMQSGCVTGTLIGHDICEEQDVAADVVARLRVKANPAEKVVGSKTKDSSSHGNVLISDIPLMVIMFLISLFWLIQSQPTFIMDHLPQYEVGANFDDHSFLLLHKLGNDWGIGL